MHLFYCPTLVTGTLELPEDEAHHARSVLRLSEGAHIGLLDGKGTIAQADIISLDKRLVRVSVTSEKRIDQERRSRIHLAVAPTKQMERFEWMLEKCMEIGVDRITPLVTARTERGTLRRDRLERVLIGAMKQSQRAWLPQLDEMTTINDLIDQGIPTQRWFGWCEGEHGPFPKSYDPQREAIMLIGPEGDFTPEEADLLRQHGFAAVGLGTARLRTETAAITACSWMNLAQLV